MHVNEEILNIFKDFSVDGVTIPVSLIRYDGDADSYVTFMREDDTGAYSADDELQGWWTYYDFDVYGQKNYLHIADAVRDRLVSAGWVWQPNNSRFDMYEPDTGFYHATLNFAHERS